MTPQSHQDAPYGGEPEQDLCSGCRRKHDVVDLNQFGFCVICESIAKSYAGAAGWSTDAAPAKPTAEIVARRVSPWAFSMNPPDLSASQARGREIHTAQRYLDAIAGLAPLPRVDRLGGNLRDTIIGIIQAEMIPQKDGWTGDPAVAADAIVEVVTGNEAERVAAVQRIVDEVTDLWAEHEVMAGPFNPADWKVDVSCADILLALSPPNPG